VRNDGMDQIWIAIKGARLIQRRQVVGAQKRQYVHLQVEWKAEQRD
jgi:hypothetical protein